MELSWSTKLRIALALGLGAICIGIWAWPLAEPLDPLGIPCMGAMGMGTIVGLAALAVAVGFAAYFISWPYGHRIAILAVPAGLAVWSLRSGTMATLMQASPTVSGRLAIYAGLRWESLFWLALVLLGAAGANVAARLRPSSVPVEPQIDPKVRPESYVNLGIGLVLGLAIAQLLVTAFAQDATLVQSVGVTQPKKTQMAFAVWVAFGAAAFVGKKVLGLGLVWTLLGSALLPIFGSFVFSTRELIEPMAHRFPAVCFPNAVICITPVHIVAFGALGSVWGYWMAVRYQYWRRHEC